MNRFIIASLFSLSAILSISSAFAQDFAQPYKKLEFGLFGTGGASIFFGDVPDGSKTDIHVAWTAGALAAYNIKPEWGVALGLGLETRGMYFKEQNEDQPNEKITIQYMSIQPSFKFKSFLIGLNLGLPMSMTQTFNGTTALTGPMIVRQTDPGAKITSSQLNTLVDVRIAGLLPIVENDGGNLDFYIQASWCVSDAIAGGFYTISQNRAESPDLVTNSPLPTVQIGLAYLFSPMGKQ